MLHLIWYIIIGLIAGLIAKSALRVEITPWAIAFGVAGAIAGGLLIHLFSRKKGARFHSAGIIVSVLGAGLVLFLQTGCRTNANRIEVDIRVVSDFSHPQAEAELRARGAEILESSVYFHRISCQIDSNRLDSLRAQPWVVAIQGRPKAVPQNDGSRNSISVDLVQGPPWGLPNTHSLTGAGVRVGIFDAGHPGVAGTLGIVNVPVHADLLGRWIPEESGIATNDIHATHVAGTIAGDGSQSANQGGSQRQWHGMAPAALVHTWAMPSEIKMLDSVMGNAPSGKPIDLSSNSWAYIASSAYNNCPNLCVNNTNGTYMMQCGDADKLVWDKKLSIFVSAGNYQTDCPNGFGSVTPLGTAKNVITVGAVTKTDTMTGFSSWGPTLDGRLKPDIVAVGASVVSCGTAANNYASLSGTSMSCPAASGLGALLIERYRQLHSGSNPDPALLKAILLNGATDLGNGGPDFKFGYGKVDAVRSVQVIDQGSYLLDTVSQQGVKTYPLSFPASGCIKVMLAWSDLDFTGGGCANPAYINDLDLELVDPNGNVYLPLTLDPTAGNQNRPAVALVNHRDNVEQVVLSKIPAGNWTARVKGFNIPTGSQGFALTWDTAAACPCVQPPADLVGWWPFDGPKTPGVTADTAGSVANDGTVNGAAYSGGMVDKALCFDGVTNFVSVPSQDEVNFLGNCPVDVPDEFTVDGWVNTTDAQGVTPILDKRINPSSPIGYHLYLYKGGLGFQMANGSGGANCGPGAACENYASSSPNVADGVWHHVAVTVKRFCQRTGSVFEGYLYVDGVQVLNFVPQSGNMDNNAPLLIGKIQPAFGSKHFKGCIDELELFKRALAPGEILAIYSAGSLGKCK